MKSRAEVIAISNLELYISLLKNSERKFIIPFCKYVNCNWERGVASGFLGIHISDLDNSVRKEKEIFFHAKPVNQEKQVAVPPTIQITL